jgi:hypothetical protein
VNGYCARHAAMTVDSARRMSLVAEDVLAVLNELPPRHPAPIPGTPDDCGNRQTPRITA